MAGPAGSVATRLCLDHRASACRRPIPPCYALRLERSDRPHGMSPKFAIVLAAGRGLRMRPLTERTPKALLPLGGRSLLDHALDRLAAAGVETVVVNAHWQAERLAEHLV